MVRLITHNLLACHVKGCTTNNFPLLLKDVKTETREAEFNPDFLKGFIPKLEWPALVDAAKQVCNNFFGFGTRSSASKRKHSCSSHKIFSRKACGRDGTQHFSSQEFFFYDWQVRSLHVTFFGIFFYVKFQCFCCCSSHSPIPRSQNFFLTYLANSATNHPYFFFVGRLFWKILLFPIQICVPKSAVRRLSIRTRFSLPSPSPSGNGLLFLCNSVALWAQ